MFDRPGPRLFGLPPGADFPAALLNGLEQRLSGQPPEAWAQVEIFVNTHRMRRRLQALFDAGPARLLPRIRLVTELGNGPASADLPPAVPPLRRRLELAQLVARLIRREPDLAPRAAVFDLADSLAGLMDEMHGEGVDPAALHDLDVSHLSAHWARTRAFISIVEHFFGEAAQEAPDAEARRRLTAQRLAAQWAEDPPAHPVIVAGSTGSRGATALFMEAVARLPQGAVVLPGFDFDQPGPVWDRLDDALTAEDHPQYRFRRLMDGLGLTRADIRPWVADSEPNPARNRLISLALRPAPVTDQWLEDGHRLTDIPEAAAAMTLIEAPSPRAEALAIALRLRQAAEEGTTAALITPDRMLTRRVAATLDRWGIEPDDSAGTPLPLSAPGRLFRHIASLFGQKVTAEALLTLLKHPLTATGSDRGPHLLWTRELELKLRRYGPPFPTGADLIHWARARDTDDGRAAWADWLAGWLDGLDRIGTRPLGEHVETHVALAERLAQGPQGDGAGALWDEAAGEKARAALDELRAEAIHGGEMSPADYANLFHAVLNRHEVRDPKLPHPGIMIWGTLEARVQGADLVILGGLNEGIWPQVPPPDPWLNRDMRKRLGLLLPERRIGLSAHDFQQAVAAREVILSRAVRDAEAETVASRWLNRLTNLLSGLPGQGGPEALDAMKQRGRQLLQMAEAFERPDALVPPAPRPAPCPPVAMRPDRLSVTRIKTLIRDPYAIYAAYVLNLRPLDPLRAEPDALLRGTILHKVLEDFLRDGAPEDPAEAASALLATADRVLAEHAPWPAARRMWRARLARVADSFVADEAKRKSRGNWVALERKGSVSLQNGFILTAEADRIDRLNAGGLMIYDYKTGTPPTAEQMKTFDKQLYLEALIAERGGFDDLPPETVAEVAYIGLGGKPGEVPHEVDAELLATVWTELHDLIDAYASATQGYMPRRMLEKREEVTDYDQLSRFGEWDESQPAQLMKVGE